MGREPQPPPARGTTGGGGGSGVLRARGPRGWGWGVGIGVAGVWGGRGGHPCPGAASGSEPEWATAPRALSEPSRSGWGGQGGGGDPASAPHASPGRQELGTGERAPRKGRGEASPSTSQGPLQGNGGPPAVPSPPGWVQSIPASPPHPASIASCLTLRLWSCRDSGAKFAEPSLFRCPHCEGWGPPLSPDTSRGWLSRSGPEPDPRSSGTWLGERPCPPPRAPPAPPRLRQPHWQPRAPPEPLGSSGSFLSLKQCCCVTHMRFPAMLCNGKMAEEKKRANEQRAEPFCCRAGRGRDGRLALRGLAQGPGRRGPPSSLPPPLQSETPGPGSPGPGQAGESTVESPYPGWAPAPLTPSLPDAFLLSSPRRFFFFGVPAGSRTHLDLGDTAGASGEKGLLNQGKGGEPLETQGLQGPHPDPPDLDAQTFLDKHPARQVWEQPWSQSHR